jgi:hypothetical protein
MTGSREMCFSKRDKILTGRSLTRLTQIMPSLFLAGATILWIFDVKALSASRDDNWYFTAEEVEAAHQYQESYEERIRNPLRAITIVKSLPCPVLLDPPIGRNSHGPRRPPVLVQTNPGETAA